MDNIGHTYILTNSTGASIHISAIGASWLSAFFPDKKGRLADVLAGYATEEGFIHDEHYMGRTIGPFANRVMTPQGIVNHSGLSSFHDKEFHLMEQSKHKLRFGLDYVDAFGIYPPMQIEVTYTLSEEGCVTIQHEVHPSQPTYLSLTNHAYFNLRGSGTAVGHIFEVAADEQLEMRSDFLPTGRILPATDKVLRLAEPSLINTCYLLHHRQSYDARLIDPQSGRCLTIRTTLPAILFYSGSFLSSTSPGKQHTPLQPCEGVAMETQFCPDSQHNQHFPPCLFTPEHFYLHTTQYQFSTL